MGINQPVPVSIDRNGQYRINGGAWQTGLGSVSGGQTIQVRLQAFGAGYSTYATLNVGGVTRQFQVNSTGTVAPPPTCTPPPGRPTCIEM